MGESRESSFVKQAAILAAAGLLVRFLGFLYRLPLTDMIKDEGNGIYGPGYTIYSFFLILSSAGLPAAISKMVSERRVLGQYTNAHRVFKVAFTFAISAGFVSMLIMWFGASYLAGLINSPRSSYAILTLAPTVFIVSVMSVYRGYFQGMGNTVPTAVSQVIEQIFNAVSSVILAGIFVKESLELGAAGGTAGTGIGAFAGLLVIMAIYTLGKPRFMKQMRRDKSKAPAESSSALMGELLRTALPIIAGTAIFSITAVIDTAMVMGLLMGAGYPETQAQTLNGLLNGKYVLLTTLPVSIATALATAVVPSMAASYVTRDQTAVKNKINLGLRITMLVSVPAAAGLGVLSDPILLLLFPNNPDGGALLRIGAFSVVLLAASQIATGMLQGISRIYIPVIAAFFGALVKIPINYYLIPIKELNVAGAVISTTVCYAVAALINLTVLSVKTKTKIDLSGIFFKPVLSSVFMGAACYAVYQTVFIFAKNNTLAVLTAIPAGIAVYFFLMFMIDGIKRSDVVLLPFGKKLLGIMEEFKLG